MKTFFSIALFLFANVLLAQENVQFRATLNSDTLGIEDFVEVTFTLEQAQGSKFQAPDWGKDFIVVSGPNQSSSFSMINGKTTQQQSFSYYLQPKEEGILTIPPASIVAKGETLYSNSLEVTVLTDYVAAKPKTKKERSSIFDFWNNQQEFEKPQEEIPQKSKKNRKVYKL